MCPCGHIHFHMDLFYLKAMLPGSVLRGSSHIPGDPKESRLARVTGLFQSWEGGELQQQERLHPARDKYSLHPSLLSVSLMGLSGPGSLLWAEGVPPTGAAVPTPSTHECDFISNRVF